RQAPGGLPGTVVSESRRCNPGQGQGQGDQCSVAHSFFPQKIERYPLPQPAAGAEGHTLAYTTTVVSSPTDFRADCCPPPTQCGWRDVVRDAASRIIFAPIFNHLALPRVTHPLRLARRWHYR